MPRRQDAVPTTTPAPSTSFAELRAAPAPRAAPGVGARPPLGSMMLRYLARSPIVVCGSASGQVYRFSAQAPVQGVARVDAEPLLASGHFRREA